MTKNIGGGRAVSVCEVCGGVDDHPKHSFIGQLGGSFQPPSEDLINAVLENAPADARGRLLRELYDTGSTTRHMDCCRDAGCPTGDCDELTKGAEDKRGKALLAHLAKEQ